MSKKILECSAKGDERFSPSFAKVNVNDKLDTIKNHYELCKRYRANDGSLITPTDVKQFRDKQPVCFEVSGAFVPIDYIDQYLKMMWYKFLKSNKELEKVLEDYDDYEDSFKGEFDLSQADIIRDYMNDENGEKLSQEERGKALYKSCSPLIRILAKKEFVMVQNGDVLDAWQPLIGHQVNCMGKMGRGLAGNIKAKFPIVFTEYSKLTQDRSKSRALLGTCQFVETATKVFANLFGQYRYGTEERQTDYEALRKGLVILKEYAVKNKMQIALPYNIGCNLAGGEWVIVYRIIKEVFNDYPVTLYNLYP